jgi:hypothetical protein
LEQGRAVLAALARHPATARHVASKLARHFVADEPPPALVERLAKRFIATQGDLKEVAKALVSAPEAWEAPRAKLKRPGEWVVGALRAVAATPADIGPVMQGPPLWRRSRSARGVRRGDRAARLGRNAADHHACRKPSPGTRASVHGAGIPTPVTAMPNGG